MPKFLKEKKAVIVLNGRYAGKKAVIVKAFDEGTRDRPYGHALVAGVARPPSKVTKRMSKKRVAKRSSLKPFVKVINYQHLMPTRYTVDVNLNKEVVKDKSLSDPVEKLKVRKEIKAKFEDRYKTGRNRWFFAKLRI